jgi:aldehyde:ferredoxin oxidoreductase
MLGGYMGKLLFVDLGSKAFHEEVLDEGIARKYIGGTGLATYLMNKYPISDYHALDPKSPLMYYSFPGFRIRSFPTQDSPQKDYHYQVNYSQLKS